MTIFSLQTICVTQCLKVIDFLQYQNSRQCFLIVKLNFGRCFSKMHGTCTSKCCRSIRALSLIMAKNIEFHIFFYHQWKSRYDDVKSWPLPFQNRLHIKIKILRDKGKKYDLLRYICMSIVISLEIWVNF